MDENRPGYWAEDIVRHAMPSAYDHDNHDYYSALDIIEDATDDYDNGNGYYAMDVLAE